MEYGLLPHAFPDGSRHPSQAAISLDLRLERYSAYATRSQTRRTLQLLPSFAGWGPPESLGSSQDLSLETYIEHPNG